MAEEFETIATLNEDGDSSPTSSSGDDLTKLFAESLNASAEAQPTAPTALKTGATAEPQLTAAHDVPVIPTSPTTPDPIPYDRFQEVNERAKQYQEQLEQQRAYNAVLSEASEFGITPQAHQQYAQAAAQQGFPDTRSYLNYLVEYQKQEVALETVQSDEYVTDAYKQQFESMVRQSQYNSQQLAKLQTQNDRREFQDRDAAISYAQSQLGFDKMPERLQSIFSKSSPDTIRALVDDLKPHLDTQRDAALNKARSEWATANAARQATAAPVGAHAGGSVSAQAAYSASNPPPLKSLFKI